MTALLRALGLGVLVLASGCGSVASSSGDAGADLSGSGGGPPTGAAGTPGAAGTAAGVAGATGAAGVTGVAGGTAGAGGAAGASAAGGTGGGSAPPGAFMLMAPVYGDPTVTTPTLTWTSAPGAASYTVDIGTSPSFVGGTEKTGVTGTSFSLPDALQPGLIYYWRVTAVARGGTTEAANAPFVMSSPVTVGPSPHGVAVLPNGSQAVITNDKPSGSVMLFDLLTFNPQTIAVPGQPAMVAVTPDGKTALVAEGSPNNVAIVDLASKAVVGAINPPCIATTLYGIAIKADGSAAVVPDLSGGCTKDVLDVIPLPGTVISTAIDLPSAGGFGVALTPDGASALLTRGILGTTVKRVDLAGGVITTISNTSSSFGVAVTPDGKEALVTSGESDTIKRISLATNAVTGTIMFDTNQDVGNIAITHDGKTAVAVGDFKVGVIKLADGSVAASYALAGRSVAITPDGHRALVTGAGATGKVYVIALP